MTTLKLTKRQANDIQLALYYRDYLGAHGSANHNWMTLVAHLADNFGIGLEFYAEGIEANGGDICVNKKQAILVNAIEITDND